MTEEILQEFKDSEIFFSTQAIWDSSPHPNNFELTVSKIKDIIPHLTSGKAYSFSSFKDGKRSINNYSGSHAIVLDMDKPGKIYTIEKVKHKLIKHKIPAIIITSKSHQKKKNDNPPCDRYHIIVFTPIIKNKDNYKTTAKEISKLIFNEKDDTSCHECSRMFFSSPSDAEVYFIYDKDFSLFPEKEADTSIKLKTSRTIHSLSSTTISEEVFDEFQRHINDCGLKYKISHYNETNGTINFFRDKDDSKPGCYMFLENNKIYDDSYDVVDTTIYSLKQIHEANTNNKIDLEELRQLHLKKMLDGIDINCRINLLKSSEGAGKSTLITKIKDKFNVERSVILFKSYEQLEDKKVLFKKHHPNLNIDIAYGTDKILSLNGIDVNDYKIKKLIIYSKDLETGVRYIDLEKTLEKLNLDPRLSQKIWDMKRRSDALCSNGIEIDILLMVEDKFKVEVLLKGSMVKEKLIIFDEFYSNTWFAYRGLTSYETMNATVRTKLGPNIEFQEAWEGVFVDVVKEKKHWYDFFQGNIVILSTEEVASDYIKKNIPNGNIIDITTTFYTDNNKFNFWSIQPKMLNRENKQKLSIAFISNGYYNLGDGIQSNYNNVNMRGKNMFVQFKDKSLNVVASHPHPSEIAIYRKNLNLTSDEARDMIMIDNINQQLGRVAGFRHLVNPKEVNVFIPNNIIYNISPKLRYITKSIHKTPTNIDKISHRIISTLQSKICGYASNSDMYLNSLGARVSRVAEVILKKTKEEAIKLIPALSSIKLEIYNRGKELIDRLSNNLGKIEIKNSSILYSDFIDFRKYSNQLLTMSYLMQNE